MQKIKTITQYIFFIATFAMSSYAAWNVYDFKKQVNSASKVSVINQLRLEKQAVSQEKPAIAFNGFSSDSTVQDVFDQKTGKQIKKIELKGSWIFDAEEKAVNFSKNDESIATITIDEGTEIGIVTLGINGAKGSLKKVAFQDFKEISEDYAVRAEFANGVIVADGGGVAKKINMILLKK